MEVFEAIKSRWSTRGFQSNALEEVTLHKFLEAGRLAPSGSNLQPYKFVVIKDKALIREYAQKCCHQDFISEAAVIIVGFVERGRDVDGAIAVENMVLEAKELGVGAVWIGWFERDKARELLNAPEKYEPFIAVPMGYPSVHPDENPKKALEDIFVINKF